MEKMGPSCMNKKCRVTMTSSEWKTGWALKSGGFDVLCVDCFIFGAEGLLSSLLISVIEKATGGDGRDSWFCDNLNKARLDCFYYLLAGLTAIAFTAFSYVSTSYIYTPHPSRKASEEENATENL